MNSDLYNKNGKKGPLRKFQWRLFQRKKYAAVRLLCMKGKSAAFLTRNGIKKFDGELK